MMHNTAGGVEAGGQVIQETTGCAGEQRHVPEDWLVEGASPQASQEDRSLRTSGSPKFHVPSQSGPRGALCGHMARKAGLSSLWAQLCLAQPQSSREDDGRRPLSWPG